MEDRRLGNFAILQRLDAIEARQNDRWQATREILDRISVIETRQSERWESSQRELGRIEKNLAGLEAALSTKAPTQTPSIMGLLGQDSKILLAAALILGAALGKSGINPVQWLFGG